MQPHNSSTTLHHQAIVDRYRVRNGMAHCPAHEDRTASMSVSFDGDQVVLVHCHAGCSQAAVIDAMKRDGCWPSRAPQRKAIESWTWTTASGKKRDQYRFENGQKTWAKRRPDSPTPADLLYVPSGIDLDGVTAVYLTEGASDADALTARGTTSIGRPNATPSAESLGRLPKGARYAIFPDNDDAGLRQARTWVGALRGAELDAALVDVEKLAPGAPPKFDARDWCARREHLDKLAAAVVDVVDVDTLDGRLAVPERRERAVEITADVLTHDGMAQVLRAVGLERRFNIRSENGEYRSPGCDWQEQDDRWVNNLRGRVMERCYTRDADGKTRALKIGKAAFSDAMEGYDYQHGVDPFLLWAELLPAWDRRPRHWLAECFPSLADNPLAEWASGAITLGAMRRAYVPGDRFHEMVVLQGSTQGTGKSSAFAWLFPPKFRAQWFADNVSFSASNKELVEAIAGRVIVEFSEMSGATRAEAERIKALITSVNDGTIRAAYARCPTSRPRRCVFVGSSNSFDFLPNDPTGLRRWVPLPVTETAPSHVHHVTDYLDANREQVWAEALHRCRRGEPHHLPDDLKAVVAEAAECFRNADEGTEAMVAAWIEEQALDDGQIEFARLRKDVNRDYDNPPSDGRLQQALKNLGYQSVLQRRARGKRCRRWVRTLGGGSPRNTLSSTSPIHSTFTTEGSKCGVCGAHAGPLEAGVPPVPPSGGVEVLRADRPDDRTPTPKDDAALVTDVRPKEPGEPVEFRRSDGAKGLLSEFWSEAPAGMPSDPALRAHVVQLENPAALVTEREEGALCLECRRTLTRNGVCTLCRRLEAGAMNE